MSWQVRHEGSPKTIDGLSLQEVVQGLADGQWEQTDEVRGPGETAWQPLESHPATAEVAAEIEPPPPPHHGDETNLDFNALIDVCLVLLIFFILTTSVAALQARLEMPEATAQAAEGPAVVTDKEVAEQMIVVTVKKEADGRVVTRIEGKEVAPDRLARELERYVRASKKTYLLLDHDAHVPFSAVVAVQDAAKGAGIEKVLLAAPEDEVKKK